MIEKKALLVGTSFSAVPILFELKKRGILVSVCGLHAGDPCHAFAEESFHVDYSDSRNLREILKSNSFDYLVPSCNDLSYMACASLAEEFNFLGFDKFDVAQSLHRKDLFRKVTKEINMPAPLFLEPLTEADISSWEVFPVLVKPSDSFSGIGMTKVAKKSDLLDSYNFAKKHSRNGKVVFEEFLEGDLCSHSAFIVNGRVELDFFVDEYCTVYPYQVNCSNHPSRISLELKNSVRDSIEKMTKSLGLTDGLLHTQFIVNKNKFWFIETMRRSPGDLYGRLIELSTGINYVDMYVRSFLGEKVSSSHIQSIERFFGRHTVSSKKRLINFYIGNNLKSNYTEFLALKLPGQVLDPAPFDKAAILFYEFDSFTEMKRLASNFDKFIDINFSKYSC
jgi:formate-dependent phosphoribosylglycinamide formyltransferase (GAR transformylase)